MYAPTNDAEEEKKEDFYHQLQTAVNKRKARDLNMVIGDLNAKVGSDTFARQTGSLSGEHSSRTRNIIKLHGYPRMGSLITRLTMWLSTRRGRAHYRTPG